MNKMSNTKSTTKTTIRAGVDYSMTCPAICVDGNKFYYLLDKNSKKIDQNVVQKMDVETKSDIQIHGYTYYNHSDNDITRWVTIGEWLLDILHDNEVSSVNFEDYSFNSNGRSFHIAENAGIAKFFMVGSGITINLISPTVIKKEATGKGTAKKEDMLSSFGQLFPKVFTKASSPYADMVDAYYLWKTETYTRTLEGD